MLPFTKIKKLPLAAVLTFASILMLSACSGSGSDDMGGDTDGDTNGGDPGPFEATFAAIQTNVFDVNCIVCHAGATPPAQMSLEADVSYSNLVGVSSTEVPELSRVAAGDPDNSYIIQKLEGTAAVGAQMPLGGTPLSADVIAVIRQWISAGAVQ